MHGKREGGEIDIKKGVKHSRRDFDDPDYLSLKSCSFVNTGKSRPHSYGGTGD